MTLHEWMASVMVPGPFSAPGLVVAINDEITVCGVDGAGRALTPDAVWPIGCLTKLALADALVTCFPDLDRPITHWLPEVGWPFTLRQLLTHTSGLPLDLPSDEYGTLTAEDVRDRMIAVDPTMPSGPMAYSNIGYGWLSLALERVCGQSLTALLASYGLAWGDAVRRPVTLADVRSPVADTPIEPFNSAYWRSLHLPWAGAYGTVGTVAALLNRLDSRVCTPSPPTSGGFPAGAYFGFSDSAGCAWADAAWGCGVEFRGTKRPHWITASASPASYGHLGSSGILVWKDGDTTIVIAGPRTTDGGWMLRQGPKGSAIALRSVIEGATVAIPVATQTSPPPLLSRT